ncbi:tRNA (adenosine(37)-N6)-dimethylallyltransferase MiaA [Halovulum sp. GXIMD14794]
MSKREHKPILIAGPTASGKSALALALAERLGSTVVNADALQVYDAWRVLSARPSQDEEERAPHALYGHVPPETAYSVGAWLRELRPLIVAGEPLVIVGGTGLYLSALTRGLAPVPHTPPQIRAEGDRIRSTGEFEAFRSYLKQFDPEIYGRIDLANGMRLQRAWEVHRATGKPLSAWQRETPEPLISKRNAVVLKLESNAEWLGERIAVRFGKMVDLGALNEVRAAEAWWDESLPASRALGATELMEHLEGRLTLQEAVDKGIIATRQFAKRQRTWFRSNMQDWQPVDACSATDKDVIDHIISMA